MPCWKRYAGRFHRTLVISLEAENCRELAPVLLHECLFHFYKAFYNYLAARALYFGGLEHWIHISLYYSKFYLARSVTTFCGRQSYLVCKGDSNFVSRIAEALGTSTYRVRLDMDLCGRQGKIVIDTGRISSHRDVWRDYRELSVDGIGLYRLLFDDEGRGDTVFGIPLDYLIKERNKENYSFEGYWHLDFNLPCDSFKHYFSDYTYVKGRSDSIYDFDSGDVLLAISSQFRLFQKLKVSQLPIEREKFLCMIDYCLPESRAKGNLLRLCREGFPTKALYSGDGHVFWDDQDRML
jgi:hypothetical protein